jgi:hypothetical protein
MNTTESLGRQELAQEFRQAVELLALQVRIKNAHLAAVIAQLEDT